MGFESRVAGLKDPQQQVEHEHGRMGAVGIGNHQPAAGSQHTGDLRDHVLLMREVMKRRGAQDRGELVVGEREAVADVALDKLDVLERCGGLPRSGPASQALPPGSHAASARRGPAHNSQTSDQSACGPRGCVSLPRRMTVTARFTPALDAPRSRAVPIAERSAGEANVASPARAPARQDPRMDRTRRMPVSLVAAPVGVSAARP